MNKIVVIAKKRWYVGVIIVVAIVIVVNTIRSRNIAASTVGNPYTVKRQNLKDTLSFAGSINAEQDVVLQFQTGGQLSWVGVKEGDHVKKYQAIASLDQRALQKTLAKYLNTYKTTRWTFDQTNADNDNLTLDLSADIRAKAQRLIDESQFALDNSVLDVELQNLALQYATIYSPIDGIVTNVDTPYPGVNVLQTQAHFEVVNPDTLYFAATADQTEVTKLAQGKTGTITFDAFPESPTTGSIYSIGYTPKSGETGTVYEIKVKFPENPKETFRIGMTGDIDFVVNQKDNVLAVPASYVQQDAKSGEMTVIKGVNGKRVSTPVVVGDTIDGSTIITSGLQEGDIVYDKAQ